MLNCFPLQAQHFTFLLAVYKSFSFFAFLSRFLFLPSFLLSVLLFKNCHPSECEVYLIILLCISLMTNDVDHLCVCVCAYWSFVYLWRNIYLNHLPIFNWAIWHFVVEFWSSLYILANNSLSDIWLAITIF